MEKIFLSSSRNILVLSLYRKILKEIIKFNQFDYFISDYYKIFIKDKFKKNKSLKKIEIIQQNLKKGNKLLLKLQDLKVCMIK